jgi:hypothetical protein
MSVNYKTILVLGSKKGAMLGKYDIAYCANLSALYYCEALKAQGGKIVSVISVGALNYSYYADAINKLAPDEAVLAMTDVYPSCTQNLKSFCEVFRTSTDLTSTGITSLLWNVANLKLPLAGKLTFEGRSLKSKCHIFMSLLIEKAFPSKGLALGVC